MGAIRVHPYRSESEPEPVQDFDETEAFEHFYADYAVQVRRMVRRYLSDGVVDDIVQEAFMQAYRSGLHLQRGADGDVATWKRLVGIARNRSIDVLRRRVRRVEEVPADERLRAVPSSSYVGQPEHHLQAARRRAGIAEALDALCERQRRVLFLKDVDGLKYDEIAASEGISLDAVKATLARARRTFREAYAVIAERDGLRVLLGGRLLTGVRARLRSMRDRMASGVGDAVSSLASATPAVGQAIVTAIVVGSIAVAGAGTAAAGEPPEEQPVAHHSDAPAEKHGDEEPDDGEHPDEKQKGEDPEGTQGKAEQSPNGAGAGAGSKSESDAPPPGNKHHTQTSAGANSKGVAEEAPAEAEANASHESDVDADNGEARTENDGDARAGAEVVKRTSEGAALVETDVNTQLPRPQDVAEAVEETALPTP